jgi:hypothetical protein
LGPQVPLSKPRLSSLSLWKTAPHDRTAWWWNDTDRTIICNVGKGNVLMWVGLYTCLFGEESWAVKNGWLGSMLYLLIDAFSYVGGILAFLTVGGFESEVEVKLLGILCVFVYDIRYNCFFFFFKNKCFLVYAANHVLKLQWSHKTH